MTDSHFDVQTEADMYHQYERRQRSLTDADIEAIAAAVVRLQPHSCRFTGINSEDLEASVRFHKTVDQLMSETGSTIRKTIIVAGIGGLISLLVLGIYAKIKQEIGIQ